MLVWLFVAFLLGFLVFITAWVPAGALPTRHRQLLGDFYGQLAFVSLERAIIVARETGGLELEPATYDAAKDADKVSLNDEVKHFPDPMSLMSRCYKKPLGLADGRLGAITDPVLAELGHEHHEMTTSGEHRTQIPVKGADGNTTTAEAISPFFDVPASERLVNLLDSVHIIPGSADPGQGETGKEFGKKSQEGFHQKMSPGQVLAMLGGFGVGLIGVWFVVKFGGNVEAVSGGGGGGPTATPIKLAVLEVVA